MFGAATAQHRAHPLESPDSLSDHLASCQSRGGRAGSWDELLDMSQLEWERLYGEPDHDSRCLRDHLGNVPVGGFFGNGEIGPVQGTTYLHGYTSAFALFRSLEA